MSYRTDKSKYDGYSGNVRYLPAFIALVSITSVITFFHPVYAENVLRICVKDNGLMYVIGKGFHKTDCRQNDRIIDISSVGPPGQTGPTGSTGATGETGTNGKTLLGGNGNPYETGTRFGGAGAFTFATEEADRQIPITGTLTDLQAVVSVAPGVGNGWIITARKNKSATPVSCTITGTTSVCTDTLHSTEFQEGDIFSVSVTPVNTPAGAGNLAWSITIH